MDAGADAATEAQPGAAHTVKGASATRRGKQAHQGPSSPPKPSTSAPKRRKLRDIGAAAAEAGSQFLFDDEQEALELELGALDQDEDEYDSEEEEEEEEEEVEAEPEADCVDGEDLLGEEEDVPPPPDLVGDLRRKFLGGQRRLRARLPSARLASLP